MHHTPVSCVLKASDVGRFTGLAWAFATTPDRDRSVIVPTALSKAAGTAPWPVLVQHAGQPVGLVERASVTDEGLEVEGFIDPSNDAYRRVRAGELGGLSMGFYARSEQSGPIQIITEIDRMVEVSVCAVPANPGAHVATLKSWRALESEIELQHLLKSTGMPGRLAQKCAAAAWPVIQKSADDDAAVEAALRRIANL